MSDGKIVKYCRNCSSELSDGTKFCPNCGQKRKNIMVSFWALVRDFFGTIFSMDSKVIRTIPVLLFRPGRLTKEYVKGRRIQYLPPVRMYVFFSIVMFLLIPWVYSLDQLNGTNIPDSKSLRDSIKAEVINDVDTTTQAGGFNFKYSQEEGTSFTHDINSQRELIAFFNIIDSIDQGKKIDESIDSEFPNKSRFSKLLLRKSLIMYQQKGVGWGHTLIKTISYSLFAFLPLFALILKLLYIRRKRLYAEHFIFSLHFLSFIFFLIIVNMILYSCGQSWFIYVVLFFFLLYLFIAMKNVYGQGFWRTLFKYISLLMLTVLLLIPTFMLLVLFGSFFLY